MKPEESIRRHLTNAIGLSAMLTLAACGGSPPQTISTSTTETTTAPATAPAPMLVPGTPGTVTTQTTHSETTP